MSFPCIFGGADLFYDDMPFQSQTCAGLQDDLVQDSCMHYIDPDIQRSASSAFDGTWVAPVQQSLKENTATLFVVDPGLSVPNHGAVGPAVCVSPAPAPYAQYDSPSSAALSPPSADTESYYDSGYPRSPPTASLHSPSQPPQPMEPFVHAVQFSSMGPADYVKLSDVSPILQHVDYCKSDDSMIDFNFAPPSDHYGGHVMGNVVPAPHGTAAPEPELPDAQSGLEQQTRSQSAVEEEIKVESQYPPLEDGTGPETQAAPERRRQHGNDDRDNDDVRHRPIKRQRMSPRTPERRAAKTTAAGAPPGRATGTRTCGPVPPPRGGGSSLFSVRARLACPDCKQEAFASQADLDSHVKKEHLRPFCCVFDFAGCTSTFGSKNEWKRHVATQHLLLNYWVCPESGCSAIFNRKDLFAQHLKRMHAPKEVKELLPLAASKQRRATSSGRGGGGGGGGGAANHSKMNAVIAGWETRVKRLQDAAVRPRCQLPTFMRCHFPGCTAPPFHGNDAWNRRMEHVARHMSSSSSSSSSSNQDNEGNRDNKNNNSNSKTPRGNGSGIGGGSGGKVPAPPPDATLIEWAARPDVAIIAPDGCGGWVLRSPLERKPGGSVVVTVPAGCHRAAVAGEAVGETGVEDQDQDYFGRVGGDDDDGDNDDEEEEEEEEEEEQEEDELVMVVADGRREEERLAQSGGEDEGSDVDAEGEDDYE
ncbi:hypothetical protein VTH06DRAFT_2308 [Thermothelomyces fergusii]